ncbi:uncharacterized protein LOC123523715 isoform X3 [Mercenaria mercenaria]|uniref:uncharacterized protein LOC123523715 isoform X3 n=1 Tax=Mercenaria mercenaria TaxID=6596 RepID=UPI00234F150D|nr:uncharacterized protein LOC123523715 isoform X3 [Mercenaria mercenaria]
MNSLGLFIFFIGLTTVKCSHFGGGIFTWAPTDDGTQITVNFRISWAFYHANCDAQTVVNRSPLTSVSMSCITGCSGTIGSLAFYCTDFKTGAWSSGMNSFTYNPSVNQFTFGFQSSAWFSLQEGGSSWSLIATVDFEERSDTGKINSSPTVDMPPVLYWQHGCSYTFTLPVSDIDGDTVKCRWASSTKGECGGVCETFSGSVLDESTCVITYTANKAIGYYAVALQIEDFVDETSTTALSSIPLQFMVNVYSGTGCSDQSNFVSPTPDKDTSYSIDIGDTISFTIKVQGPNTFHRIITMSKIVITRSSEVNSADTSWNYITMTSTWTSSDADETHKVCFYSRDTIGVTSDTRCITIHVSGNDNDNCSPEPCQNGGTCTDAIGDYSCACIDGYTDKTCSTDIDECTDGSNNCDVNAECTNTVGSFTCTCNDGYISNGTACSDKDECNEDSNNCDVNAECKNTVGSFTCACNEGYSGNGTTCSDIDECADGSNNCDANAECTNTIGSFTCSCNAGYSGNGTSCTDINECNDDSHNCDVNAECTNTVGNFTCSCNEGYSGNGTTCSDIDECADGSNNCDANAECTNTIGSFTCSCNAGYSGNGTSCSDRDECNDDSHNCDVNAECTNTVGSFTCTCNEGYSGNGTTCSDIDECADGSNNCDANAECTNTIGSFTCSCNAGYSGNGTSCSDINECNDDSHNCDVNAKCTNTVGNFTCSCNEGYSGNGTTCSDIDECADGSNNCDANAECTNTIGSFTCSCNAGYSGNGTSCTDRDECNDDSHNCEVNAECTNTIGSFTCTCNEGYSGNGTTCLDIDECADGSNNCDANAECTNTIGSFTCSCNAGYSGNGTSCTDRDECNDDSHNCEVNAECTNTIGSFTCTCNEGYSGNGTTCLDIDECADGSNNCDANAKCTNTIGSFTCSCNAGYSGNGTSCTDRDECNDDSHNCEVNAECTNTVGTFTCTCNEGYSGNGTTCLDIDECADGSNDCDANAKCTNTIGSFTCSCNAGYSGNGTSCSDINECNDDSHNCDVNAECTNTVGNFTCSCSEGYSGNGTTCSDIDECADGSNNCDANAECTNTIGNFTCSCNAGYSGNGTSCSDINECNDDSHNCDVNAECTNTVGNFTCSCNEGYSGNGTTCSDIDECADGSNNCDANAECSNTIGGFTCSCNAGYSGNGTSCSDINECNGDSHNCDVNAECTNTVGSFACSCNEGYSGNGTTCSDIDECANDSNKCDANAECTNTIASFTCSCNAGYSGNGTSCSDIDECNGDSHNCNVNAECTNTVGSFTCTCNEGFFGNGTTCSDNDECADGSNNCDANAECTNTIGSFTCSCNAGYSGNGTSCSDINECNDDIHNCDVNAECTNTVGSFACTCNEGYSGIGRTCSDIDECADGSNNCDANAECTNIIGSFTCSCNAGYSGNGTSCSDIDECNDDSRNCNVNAECTNTIGSFTCSCNEGYFGNGTTCSDNDECADGSNNCDANAECTNTIGSFTCSCNAGYFGNGTSCSDIDECNDNSHNCDVNAECTNTVGSFACTCNEGYSGNGTTCSDIDECADGSNNCDANAGCTNTIGSFTCSCNAGYSGNGTSCSDTDECYDNGNNCDVNAECMNTVGSFTCTCNEGYSGNGTTCSDIDECTDDSNNCDANAECTNTVGSFTCSCNAGYSGNGTSCSDLDECNDDSNNCDVNAECTNTVGSFTCTCNKGYSGNGTTCSDFDECTDKSNNCDINAKCTNTFGSFTCTCNEGYTSNRTSCIDIDECNAGSNNCDVTAECKNTVGSFTCNCNEGFSGNGTTCSDIDECTDRSNNCDINAECTNTVGSFSCTCIDGYSGNGTACSDIDECTDGSNNCDINAECTNTVGSFSCTCIDGYSGNGTACSDENECNDGSNKCDVNAECTNTVGSFTCTCNEGYSGNGTTCSDIDECTDGSNNCDANAKCTNTVGSFTCTCNDGYTGNGTACLDIDECIDGSNNCDANAECTNNIGSFTCTCNKGYYGNGTTCSDIDECTEDSNNCDVNAECTNTIGSFICTCNKGYSGNGTTCLVAIGGACENNDICRTPGAKCINSTCSCKTGIHNEEVDVCDAMFLYPFGVRNGDQVLMETDDSCSKPIRFQYGIPVFEHAHTTAYVCTNGLISLNVTYTNPVPNRNISLYGKRTVVAPFFADTDMTTSGAVYYRYLDVLNNAEELKNNDVRHVEAMIERLGGVTAFNAKFILFATWDKVMPFQDIFNTTTEATFQAVIVTDGIDTYTLFIYGYKSMLWTMANELKTSPDIWIGYTASGKSSTNINSFKTTALLMDSHALTKGISGLLFSRLTPIGVRLPNAAMMCLDWFNENKHKKSDFQELSGNGMPDCPCNLDSLSFDPWYWPADETGEDNSTTFTVEILPSQLFGQSGKTCSYNKTTGLWTNEIPEAGGLYIYHPDKSLSNHIIHDIEPKQFCCDESSLCSVYYDLHPIGNCYKETWFQTGSSWGDPHFDTLDKKNFTFNGLGEYSLIKIKTDKDEFDLQARTDRAVKEDGTLSYATIFKAFAAQDHTNASFHAELNNDKDGLILYGNGADLSLMYNENNQKSFRYKSEENNLAIIRRNDTLVVFFPNTGISLNISVGVQMLSISATVPKIFKNKTKGLLGNFDGDPDNDFFTPNGSVLPSNLDEKEIFYYGQSWQIGADSSVFYYSDRLGPADYSNASYIPKFLMDANKTKVEEAKRICGGDENVQCVFDYVFTEDKNVARHTKNTKTKADEASIEIDKKIPSLDGCDVLHITKGDQVSCPLKIPDGEGLEFNFIDNTANATYNSAERTVIYRHDNDLPVTISISVVNQDNKSSTPFRVNVHFCSGCHGHGVCTDIIRIDPRETEHFKYRECDCEPQYEGLDCEDDFDGCAANPCSLNRECTSLTAAEQIARNKTHICGNCPDGFSQDGDKCIDINECEEESAFCEHNCVNTDGSFDCVCNHGYRSSSKNRSRCNDINECDEAMHNCTQECVNTNGGFNCTCKTGFTFNVTTWTCMKADVNVCEETEIDCSETAGCTIDEDSNPVCFCESGFELSENGTSCTDVNECESNVCPQSCNNYIGGFACFCYAGFKLQDETTCQECEYPLWGHNCKNECKCTGQGTFDCDPVRGCICREGWYGDTCDDDIDECDVKADPCNDVRKECFNVPGGYTCKCRNGFTEKNDECIDIDECSSPLLNDCTQTCDNTVGGFTCGCYSGFTKHNRTHCQDIDECSLRQHSCEQKCLNFPGLYNCYCHFGYILEDDRRTCKKVSDPCKSELNLTCSHYCVLGLDSAACHCRQGFNLASDEQACLDIDECSDTKLNLCSDNAECVNIEGSFLCNCPTGSKLDNDGRTCSECDQYHYGEKCLKRCSCLNGYCDRITGCVCRPGWTGENCDKDLDECSGSVCKISNTECVNTPGSFLCRCKSGYETENDTCKDINECSDVKLNSCDQICTNTIGSYVCSCETGFVFRDGKCEDLDECAGKSKFCDQECDNTVGGYRCSCRDGFRLDTTNRQSCIPKKNCNETEEDECLIKKAECIIINGKSKCSCLTGYTFNDDGLCEDEKECSEIPTPCNHKCLETDGGFNCACEPGFYLLPDEITCQECDEGSYGDGCKSICNCSLYNTKSCNPVNGSCDCLGGWEGDRCDVDINECELMRVPECPDNSECVNTEGSFLCECNIGYLKTADGVCEICDRQWYGKDCSSKCSCVSENTDICSNTDGTCTCKKGWIGENCTEDVDECGETLDICLGNDNAICHNTLGSYRCDCAMGYVSQNNTCIDKNECLDGTAKCLQECVNTGGSYICKCSLGYQGYWNSCKVCSSNMYGENCTGACRCNTTNTLNTVQSCDIQSGQCRCKPEWNGDTCETDVNECLNDGACAKKKHSGCINIPGSYRCDCLRGFQETDGKCVAEEITTIPPISGDSRELNLSLRLDVSPGVNLNTSVGYKTVKQNVKEALSNYFCNNTGDKCTLRINDIRTGSIIVDFTIIYESTNTDLGTSLANAAVDLVTGSTLEYTGNPVRANLIGPFDNDSSVCEIYTQVQGPCPPASKCSEVNGSPTCREIPTEDIFSLYIGLGAGCVLVILILLIFALAIRKLRERRERKKQAFTHINRLHRDGHFPTPPLLADKTEEKVPQVTTTPLRLPMSDNRTRYLESHQGRQGMVWKQSRSQNFGIEKGQGMLPRFDPSVLRPPPISNPQLQ